MFDKARIRLGNARRFLATLWQLARPYWFAPDWQQVRLGPVSFALRERWIARGTLLVVVVLGVLTVYVAKLLNDWNARFFNALQGKNSDAYWHELVYWVVIVAIYIVMAVYRVWLLQLLTIRWRRWLSEMYFNDWLAGRAYYRMELTGHGTDNPEQRIEQDCSTFVSQTLSLTLELFQNVMTVATFVVILWQLSSTFTVPLFGGLVVPGYMMWVAIIYAALGSILTYRIGRPLVRVNFMLERTNADFRYRMTRIRENAESVALYRGERNEADRLERALGHVYDTWWDLMHYNKRLTWLTSFYGQAASIFPFIVAAPHYFTGDITFGVLTQTAGAFGQVQASLSWFVTSYATLADWTAVVQRLTTFREAIDRGRETDGGVAQLDIARTSPDRIELDHVSVLLPDGAPLLADVAFTIDRGEKLVLGGPSGAGKTTLFRVLAGLWPFGRGRVVLPDEGRVLFLPQRPYLPVGSLKDVLAYPQRAGDIDDARCSESLMACGLGQLAQRLDEPANWSMLLSGGEQQRLAFARALLFRPDWLFLDEATSNLDEASERQLYDLLRQRLPAATLISIAHRPSVTRLHRRHLEIDAARHVIGRPMLSAPSSEG